MQRNMSKRYRSFILRYGCAAVSVAAAIGARLLLDPVVGQQFPFATVFFAVLTTAWYGGLRPALVAVLLGALGSDFFLMPPRGSFELATREEYVGLFLFFVTGLGISLLAGALHSARERAESTAESMQHHADLIDQTYDAMLVWDWNGPISFWNRGAERLYGFPREEAVGRVSHDLLRTKTTGGVATFIDIMERNGSWEGELHHTSRDGQTIIVDSRMMLICEADRAYVIEANRNITDRKKAETELRELNEQLEARVLQRAAELAQSNERLRASEEHSRLILDGVRDHAILMLDSEGTILTWNRGAETIDGYTAEEIVGRHFSCLFTPELIAEDKPAEELEKAAAEGKVDIEGWRVRKNGSRFWVNGALTALYDEHGQVRGFAKITRDLTAKRRNDELLQSVLNHTLDGIISIDELGTVSLINRAGETLFGRPASEVVGQNIKILMPDPYHSEHDGYLANYKRTGEAQIIGSGREVLGLRKDGATFPLDLAVTEFQLDNQRHFVGIVRDVSERKKLEAQLRQSQKMEAFGQLAGGVSHDFNNLLTVISGYSDLLLTKLSSDDPKKRMVDQIHRAAERAAALTRQLLAFSRQQVLEAKIVDLNVVVTDVEKMLRRLIGEDVQITTVLTPGISSVRVDPGQMEQVIMNLAVNARDAMPQGGKLTIETGEAQLDETYAKTHPEARPGRFVVVAISDGGCGMPPEVKVRIFEPFYTTKGVGKGTGLGLAVVHGIVKQSGGNIDVYSEVDIGTTFRIYLPAMEQPVTASPAEAPEIALRGSETILLVEDEESLRDFARLALEERGYTVLSAPEGLAALQLMESGRQAIDLLLTDVVMPGMGGRRLAETLVDRHPELKVLFMSGYTDDAVVRHGVLQDNVEFLQKPFSPNSLVHKVRDVLDRK
jgi:two-component system cell cycle sensor histidine kinase/response regulator CckA